MFERFAQIASNLRFALRKPICKQGFQFENPITIRANRARMCGLCRAKHQEIAFSQSNMPFLTPGLGPICRGNWTPQKRPFNLHGSQAGGQKGYFYFWAQKMEFPSFPKFGLRRGREGRNPDLKPLCFFVACLRKARRKPYTLQKKTRMFLFADPSKSLETKEKPTTQTTKVIEQKKLKRNKQGLEHRHRIWPGEGSTAQWKWSPPAPGSLKALLFPPLLNNVQTRERKGYRWGTARNFVHSFPLSSAPVVQSYWAWRASRSSSRRWANGVVRKWGRTDLTGF